MLASMTDWLLQERTNDQHGVHVYLIFEIAAVETPLTQRYKQQEFALENMILLRNPRFNELLFLVIDSLLLL